MSIHTEKNIFIAVSIFKQNTWCKICISQNLLLLLLDMFYWSLASGCVPLKDYIAIKLLQSNYLKG